VPLRLDDLLSSFRRHLRAAAKAPRTIEPYSQSVRYFSRWLIERDRPATLDELSRHAISAWLAELVETAEPSTVATRLRGMRRLAADAGQGAAIAGRGLGVELRRKGLAEPTIRSAYTIPRCAAAKAGDQRMV
jgi:Phage integrase, N-terminal SAM-like domain